ncbi:MAG: hypothetical protein HY328_00910 [Chloroflexi bacterium]|nr:hypothetical protein [Chloroflexota bacterium]
MNGGYLGQRFPSYPGYAAIFAVERVGAAVEGVQVGELRSLRWRRLSSPSAGEPSETHLDSYKATDYHHTEMEEGTETGVWVACSTLVTDGVDCAVLTMEKRGRDESISQLYGFATG